MKIGVALPIAEREGQQVGYDEIRALALQAEDEGLDSIWFYDHLLFRSQGEPTRGIWECWTLLSALAEATKRVELGTLVLCTAFRNPALLAKMAVTLDAVSKGRLILGLGAGWHQPEFDAFGLPFDHLAGRFEEALSIIVPLVREGKVDFEGRYYSAKECEMAPGNTRAGGPPILIGASRPRMLELTARHADLWNTCWLGPVAALAPRLAPLEEARQKVGREAGKPGVTVGVFVHILAAGEEIPAEVDRERVIVGTVEEVGQALYDYQQAGAVHLICALRENTSQAYTRLAQAAQYCRKLQAQ
jgi:alkanesulfonate monooxygenase SsuD/methylene tetrahydromethanopterin reductase-like flavin-dependent oxidoreductase (luciferase family)